MDEWCARASQIFSPINSTHFAKLCPESGDRMVTIHVDSVMSVHPMYMASTCVLRAKSAAYDSLVVFARKTASFSIELKCF